MMTLSMFGTMSSLGMALGLVTACSSKVQSLGDDATGGNTNETTGGANGTTGGANGTTGGAGGQGSVVPYVVDPTLPIDPSCTCDASDQICNAASQCVPRCDDSGRCASWLANHAVKDLLVEGTSLFYAVGAGTDPLGNASTDGSFYRVDTTGGTPVLIAGGLVNPYKIVGRYAGVTYIETKSDTTAAIVSVSDAGAVSNLDQDVASGEEAAMLWGHWLAYLNADQSKLMGIDLTSNLTPVVLAQVPTSGDTLQGPLVLDNQVLYGISSSGQTCSIQPSNLVQGSTCADGGIFNPFGGYVAVATTGDKYFVSLGTHSIVASYAPLNTQLLTLFSPNVSGVDYSAGNLVYANGWLYMNLYGPCTSAEFVRVPTTLGRLPQAVIPDSMATLASVISHSGGGCELGSTVFAVSDTAFFWVQMMDPSNSNQPQYIFSAPLPPYPCDADLPCADSTQVCSNGFC